MHSWNCIRTKTLCESSSWANEYGWTECKLREPNFTPTDHHLYLCLCVFSLRFCVFVYRILLRLLLLAALALRLPHLWIWSNVFFGSDLKARSRLLLHRPKWLVNWHLCCRDTSFESEIAIRYGTDWLMANRLHAGGCHSLPIFIRFINSSWRTRRIPNLMCARSLAHRLCNFNLKTIKPITRWRAERAGKLKLINVRTREHRRRRHQNLYNTKRANRRCEHYEQTDAISNTKSNIAEFIKANFNW